MHILILGGGGDLPSRAREILPGLRTSVICQQQTVPHLKQSEKIQRLVVLPAGKPISEWVAAARYIHHLDPVERVVNYTEYDTENAVAISEDLGLPMPNSSATYNYVSNKCAMRARLSSAGVDDTEAAIVSTESAIRQFADRVGYPVMCKPVSGVGSRGISYIRSKADIAAALNASENAAATLDVTELLVEPFHRGTEYSVEAFSDSGRHLIACVTEKHIEPATFVEVGHTLPAALKPDTQVLVENTIVKMLDALGVENGVTHTELILTDDQPRIVETHLRPAGDQIPKMLAHVSGIDLFDAFARQSVGVEVYEELVRAQRSFEERATSCAAIWYATSGVSGEVTSVAGLDAARSVDGVEEVSLSVDVGGGVAPMTMSKNRLGYAWATAASTSEALGRAQSAVRSLQINIA